MTELGGDPSLVTLSDDVVVLRPWTRSEASFIAEASRDPAIERYNDNLYAHRWFTKTLIGR